VLDLQIKHQQSTINNQQSTINNQQSTIVIRHSSFVIRQSSIVNRQSVLYLPGALARKFRRAAESFEWFWLFPARQVSLDPETQVRRRHHLHGKVYNEAIKRAAGAAGIEKRVTSHALRNAYS